MASKGYSRGKGGRGKQDSLYSRGRGGGQYEAGWQSQSEPSYNMHDQSTSMDPWRSNGLQPLNSFSEGDEVTGTVKSITNIGIFVNFGCVKEGLLSMKEVHGEVAVGELLEGLIVSRLDLARNRVSLRNPSFRGGHAGRGYGKNTSEAEEANPWGSWQAQEDSARKQNQQVWDGWDTGWKDQQWWSESWNGDNWDSGEQWSSHDWRDEGGGCSNGSQSGAKEENHQGPGVLIDRRSYYGNGVQSADASASYSTSVAEGHTPVVPDQPPASRAELISAVFRQVDADCDGFLASSELRNFASHTGFSGSDSEWLEEYGLLCRELGCSTSSGLDERAFSRMVNDDSDKGCWCDDEELADMFKANKELETRGGEKSLASMPATDVATPAPAMQASAVDPPEASVLSVSETTSSREQMKAKVFRILDKDQDGYLLSYDMRVFAEHTGFGGDENEWDEEYRLLCSECFCDPDVGINEATWNALVDDTSSEGLDCSDEELASFLMEHTPLEVARPSARETQPERAPQRTAMPEAAKPPPTTREQLKAAVFRHFDKDGDDLLGRVELRAFAEGTGFSGSDSEWSDEYELICGDMRTSPAVGLDEASFSILVDDDSDKGCYCSDEELKQMLGSEAGATNSSTVEATAPTTAAASGRDRGRPTADDSRQAVTKGKSVGKGQTKAEGSNTKGKRDVHQASAHVDSGRNDPWASQADPWATPSAPDPWATPSAQRMHHKQLSKEISAERGGKGGAGSASAEVTNSDKAEDSAGWKDWTEAGKPGAFDHSKPALNVQKLLEASRAANAARKAKEVQEEQAQAAVAEVAALSKQEEDDPEVEDKLQTHEQDDDFELPHAVEGGASGSRSVPTAPRITTTAGALAQASSAIARLAEGDPSAASDLVNAIAGAPNAFHVLAVATSAVRALLQGKLQEARVVLSLKDMILEPIAGEAALLFALGELGRRLGASGGPFLLRPLLAALAKVGDKHYEVRSAAASATEGTVKCVNAFAFEALMPTLLAALDAKRSPALKLHALKLLGLCWKGEGEEAVAHKLPQLLPITTALLLDTNNDVKSAAADAVEVLLALCGNSDLAPHLDEILGCAKGKKDVPACVKNLAEVVFVQQVEARALAVVMPVLTKGLRNRNARTQRQACIIAENMCRLVPSVADVEPFTPQLLPLLKKINEEAADPDVRAVAGRAHGSLSHVSEAGAAAAVRHELRSTLAVAVSMAEAEADTPAGEDFTPCPAPVRDVVIDYLITMCVGLGNCCIREEPKWRSHLKPFLEPLAGRHAEGLDGKLHAVGKRLSAGRSKAIGQKASDNESDEDDPRQVLCDVTFTLACGAATLLSSAHLRLVRNRVYGLVGANDSGKSAILRAIHERKVKGFPPPGELVSTLVEHGVGEKPPECNLTPSQYLISDPVIKRMGLPEKRIHTTLRSLGFDEGGRLMKPISTLSGGWKMKLSLARAVVQAADVVLLDEPTGHLDRSHVDWLIAYIQSLTKHPDDANEREDADSRTIIIVSHDASFLDQVCTHIIHVQGQKLSIHKGNFSDFMMQVPDAQLGSATGEQEQPLSKFVLPDPGVLEGVKSRGKRFLYMENAVYSYPQSSAPAIRSATVECSLRSRIAIIGPNGAGKSTLAGLVVGEILPDLGNIWRHPNLRVAYVAQHTFHHLEQHLDLTATEYILWRFAGHEDREALEFRADEVEQGEVKAYELISGQLFQCDAEDDNRAEPEIILGRRQRGRLGYEYEVKWQHPRNAASCWVPRAQLVAMGHLGMVKREDEREAAQRALIGRQLTTPGVEAHLAGFGLDAEEATHRRLGALSNGQRARAVLGAATWLSPHLLLLDEPSNYLDRPALAALAAGLQSFGGGLIAISHNLEFLDEVCTERWLMNGGLLRREGAAVDDGQGATDANAKAASAASVAAKEAKEKKKAKRMRELRKKNGEAVGDEDDDWYEDLLKKANHKGKGA